jgi:hypothetical protein
MWLNEMNDLWMNMKYCECHLGYAVTRSIKPPRAPYDALVLIGRIDWCYACGKPKEKKDESKIY